MKLLKESYPEQWQQIVEANNSKAPMWLRVNHQHHTRAEYQALLEQAGIVTTPHAQAEDALCLETPCDVHQLPGFAEGWVSVQDAAAQLALTYLAPQAGELILDCCAAPVAKLRTSWSAHQRAKSSRLIVMKLASNACEKTCSVYSSLRK